MKASQSARIIEWDFQKGFGYLDFQGKRLFLHIRDFAEKRKRPEVGDRVRFSIGEDRKGRKCAVEAVHSNQGGKIAVLHSVFLLGLMFLPALASLHFGLNPFLMAGYVVVVASITILLYALDKMRATSRQSRVSETMLHFFELIGGWPGAFLAQRRIRHKCTKGRYQVIFWLIVFGYQVAAIDYLSGWRFSSAAFEKVTVAVDGIQR